MYNEQCYTNGRAIKNGRHVKTRKTSTFTELSIEQKEETLITIIYVFLETPSAGKDSENGAPALVMSVVLGVACLFANIFKY